MKHPCRFALLGMLLSVFFLTSNAYSIEYKFTTLTFPDTYDVSANDINDAGKIVGFYFDRSTNPPVSHGFLWSGDSYSTLDCTNASSTAAQGINNKGQIVGQYDNGGPTYGFLLSGGSYNTIDYPQSISTLAVGINSDGHIVGFYFVKISDTANITLGFLWNGASYSTIGGPTGALQSVANDINNASEIVGYYNDNKDRHGFLFSGDNYTNLDVPGASLTIPYRINDQGQVVGYYLDNTGEHGFLWANDNYSTIDYPGASRTILLGINNVGEMVGHYYYDTGGPHAFLATPTPLPSTLLLFGPGLLSLLGWRRFKKG